MNDQHDDSNLIARSQAKRLVAGLQIFKEVVLDFANIETIGPAFADEIFWVFVNEHPDVKIFFVNATDEVQKMIRRAQTHQE